MDVVETFGDVVADVAKTRPAAARGIMRAGWQAMDLKFRYLPDKRLMPADQYLADMMMSQMLKPLRDPDHAAIVSIFTPCEMLQDVGLAPYNAEAYSSYISASRAEGPCVRRAEDAGIADTLCTYHRTFLGAASAGLLPRPRCIVSTTLTCDANLLTFKKLAEIYDVEAFQIDVPVHVDEQSVSYVEEQLHDLAAFLERMTGNPVSEDRLREREYRAQRSLLAFQRYQRQRATRQIKTDLVTPFYAAMTNNILLGTSEEERYTRMLTEDVMGMPQAKGVRLYWMHVIPYWMQSVWDALAFNDRAQIVGMDLAQAVSPDFDPDQPFRAMAHRLVYNNFNGGAMRRIQAGIEQAKTAGADGVVWFNHWGCKHTIGPSQLAKRQFEKAGLPCLVLDGDACDRSFGGEGQLATRLNAFLEMLEA